MAEQGASGVGGGQAEDEEVDWDSLSPQEANLQFLKRLVRYLEENGDRLEVTSYGQEAAVGSRVNQRGMIEQYPTGVYHVQFTYRRKP